MRCEFGKRFVKVDCHHRLTTKDFDRVMMIMNVSEFVFVVVVVVVPVVVVVSVGDSFVMNERKRDWQ